LTPRNDLFGERIHQGQQAIPIWDGDRANEGPPGLRVKGKATAAVAEGLQTLERIRIVLQRRLLARILGGVSTRPHKFFKCRDGIGERYEFGERNGASQALFDIWL
jgi:hypothetical protein